MKRDKKGRFVKGVIPYNKNKKTGKHSWNYKGLDKLTFICKDCGCKISKKSVLYGLGMCKSCSHKGNKNINFGGFEKNHSINLANAHKGKPSNFKGHKHREESKDKLSKTQKIRFKDPRNHPCFGKSMKPHFVNYKNIWFRSNWEVIYAKELDVKKIKWEYEPKTFDLGKTTYRPDFYLIESNSYIEVKGYKSDVFKKKFKLFKKLYPKIKIKILDEKYFKERKIK